MKVLVYAHRLEVGGTQTNAIELSAALRDNHEIDTVFFATPGPMTKLIEDKRLRFVEAPDAYIHPSFARMNSLRNLVRAEKPDVIHVWDWWQYLDALYAVYLPMGVPVVVTDMMMTINRILPKQIPITFGIPELVDQAKSAGWKKAQLLVPPVDTRLNAPNLIDSNHFRKKYSIKKPDITLVIVSRLANWMKSESLIRSIEAVRLLGRSLPLRLLIVGDGAARSKLELLAAQANDELNRDAVILTGALIDPRPAYDAADIVIGMGGSALRGMAFGKPVIIVGEQGFSAPLTPETAESFYYKGIYGLGDGSLDNSGLISDIRNFAEKSEELKTIGDFSRQFVCQNFSLDTVSEQLCNILKEAIATPPDYRAIISDSLRSAAIYLRNRYFLIPSRDKHPQK